MPLRWGALAVLALALILVPFLLFEAQFTAWGGGVLEGARREPAAVAAIVIALLAGDVVLPVPSSLVSTFSGGVFGWAVGAVVIWVGMMLGCITGYGLGASAGRLLAIKVVGEGEMARAQRLFRHAGPAALIVARAAPVLAEASTLAAGAARMPIGSFLLATAVANLGVSVAYAAVGAAAFSAGSFLIAFMGLAAIPAAAWGAWRFVAARRNAL